MSCKVSFIGLGVMGFPMAGYISKAGHNVTVFNRTKSKAEKWLKTYKGKLAETPAEAEAAEGEIGAEGADAAATEGGDKPAADGDKKEGEDKKPAEEKK